MTVNVLDHGYVRLVESWGSDERVIESARMSTDGAFRGWGPKPCTECDNGKVRIDLREDWLGGGAGHTGGSKVVECPTCKGTGQAAGDEKLLRYLWKNGHATPFEMAGATFEIQAPIFVFREWHRHRTQGYSELSARYTELPELFYVPSAERLEQSGQGVTNRQGSGWLDPAMVPRAAEAIESAQAAAFTAYAQLLACGVAREVARVVLPVGMYSRMRATANLRNWLGFLTLRQAANAQWEIRQYADLVAGSLAAAFPRTLALHAETAK